MSRTRLIAFLAAAGVLVALAVAVGYLRHQAHRDAQSLLARYDEAIRAFERGDRTRATAIIKSLPDSHRNPSVFTPRRDVEAVLTRLSKLRELNTKACEDEQRRIRQRYPSQ